MGKHYFNTDLLFDQFLFGSFTVYKNLHIFLWLVESRRPAVKPFFRLQNDYSLARQASDIWRQQGPKIQSRLLYCDFTVIYGNNNIVE